MKSRQSITMQVVRKLQDDAKYMEHNGASETANIYTEVADQLVAALNKLNVNFDPDVYKEWRNLMEEAFDILSMKDVE